MKVWIDIKNSHEPLFFKSIISNIADPEYKITCRDFAEIIDLLDRYKFQYKVIGNRPEGSMLKRKIGYIYRIIQLFLQGPAFNISLNHCSSWSIIVSKLKYKKTIVFTDNETNPDNRWFLKGVDYLISPKSISKEYFIRNGLKPSSLISFNGFKEDIYLADYVIKDEEYAEVPFRDFVAIRPENLQARYYSSGVKSIVPELLEMFQKANVNVLFLPRYKNDYQYGKGFDNVFIPQKALNGLDVCYYSRAVITGGGTFAREAACMGQKAISFSAGKEMLSVDKDMVRRNWLFHSRNPSQIVDYVLNSDEKPPPDLERSKMVQNEVLLILKNIFDTNSNHIP